MMSDYKKIQDLFESGEINIRKVILILTALAIETSDNQLKHLIGDCLATLTRIEHLVIEELHGIIDPEKITQKSFLDLSEYCKQRNEKLLKPSSKFPKFIPAPPSGNSDIDENLSHRYSQL